VLEQWPDSANFDVLAAKLPASTQAMPVWAALSELLESQFQMRAAINLDNEWLWEAKHRFAQPHAARWCRVSGVVSEAICRFEDRRELLQLLKRTRARLHCAYSCNSVCFFPVSLSAYESRMVAAVPDKTLDFTPIVPGNYSTYKWGKTDADEIGYYKEYQHSRFGLTYKKAGWDCHRHYEILSSGAVPYFTDLAERPPYTLSFLPHQLLDEARSLAGVKPMHIDHAVFNKTAYLTLAKQLLEYTNKHLTASAMARYVLEASGNEAAKSVLWINQPQNGDYLRDNMMVGFRHIFGDKMVDVPAEDYMYTIPTSADHNAARQAVYGGGFGFAFELSREPVIDRSRIRDRIHERSFDIVIYGSIWRSNGSLATGWFLPPVFWQDVIQSYPRNRIIMFDGEDIGGLQYQQQQMVDIAARGMLFLRESTNAFAGCRASKLAVPL